jgi:reactive intermediate/imine deaminase
MPSHRGHMLKTTTAKHISRPRTRRPETMTRLNVCIFVPFWHAWHAGMAIARMGLLYLAAVSLREDHMPRQIITTANAPSSPLYSQGVKAGPHVLVSGIVGIDPNTGSLAGDTIHDQTRQAMTNCQAILRAGGADLEDVIEVGILLSNPADFAGLNEEYARWFPAEPPTRYVAKLGVELPGLLVSIRMTAFTA